MVTEQDLTPSSVTLMFPGAGTSNGAAVDHERRVRLLIFEPDDQVSELNNLDTVDELLDDGALNFWLDLQSPTNDDLALLAEEFRSHPLALDEIGRPQQRAKIQQFDDSFFVTFYALEEQKGQVWLNPVWFFLGRNYLVTVHERTIGEVEETAARWRKRTAEIQADGPGIILYSVIDSIVDGYFPILDHFGDRLDDIEDLVFETPRPETIRTVFSLRRELLELRRVIGPERDVMNILARRDQPLFGRETAVYFQDVYDHVQRVLDTVDTYRDVLIGAVDVYLSTVSNRVNEVMKRMTAIGTLLVTLSIVTGAFGMNVVLPFQDSPYGFWLVVLLMAALSLGILGAFRRAGWL